MNSVASNPALIGLDWGTTSLRALLIGSSGEVLDVISSPQGIMQVEDRNFDAVFHNLVQPWMAQAQLPVIASGMITSRNGWVETPYIDVPAGIDELANALLPFETSQGQTIHFITGMTTEHDGAPDVMRGEETQIIGAASMGLGDGTYVMPGTHSKWLTVTEGRIVDYSTYMTGEMFAVIKAHTILGTLMKDSEFSKEGFTLGVKSGLSAGIDWLHQLFHVRTMPLFNKISEDMTADYLSGMLMGAEIASGMRTLDRAEGDNAQVTIISRGDLADRYEIALNIAGLSSRRAADNIVAHGHYQIAKQAGLL